MDAENRIVVELDECNEEQIAAFKKQVIDSPAIEFKQASGKTKPCVDFQPGEVIQLYDGSNASAGYRAKKNGVIGFVTAAHFAYQGCSVYKFGIDMATCTARQNSGSVDAAFCQITNSVYTPSNTIYGTSNNLSTTISEPGVGTVINKVGYASGHTSGTIISTNATVTTTQGVTLTNLTSSSLYITGGDSGGIVYSVVGSNRYTLGIIMGYDNSSLSYFVKANQINSALGVYRY